jgi:hypothetical protein
MELVKPKVHLIAETTINHIGMNDYLKPIEEIRVVFRQIQKLLKTRYNSVYQDIPDFEY